MKTEMATEEELFLERVEQLYSRIRDWLSGESISCVLESVSITESGKAYEAPVLKLNERENRFAAKLIPVGWRVVGAEGRIDLMGNLDRTVFAYLKTGGPIFTTKEKLDDSQSNWTKPRMLFKNIEEEGWYWIEDQRLGKAKPLDKELLLDIIGWVSGYEL